MTSVYAVESSPVKATQANWKNSTSVEHLDASTHVWAIELHKSPAYLDILSGWLSEKEQDRANRIVIAHKRNYQIQSKAWLRWLLAQYTQSSPQAINYRHGHLGKPYLDANTPSLQFNATDSGTTLLIAFHQSNELGLDIEAIPRNVNYQGIAKRKLTTKEFELLTSLPLHQQTNAFLALWTRKEGYGKAIGLGIRYPMNKVHLCDDFNNESHFVQDNDNRSWYLQQIGGMNFVACLVSSAPATTINFYTLDIDSLELNNV